MRIECETCHEVVAARFAIEGGEVVATCERCATRMTTTGAAAPAAAAAGAASDPAVAVPRTATSNLPKINFRRARGPSRRPGYSRHPALAGHRDTRCPKCDRVRAGEAACPGCGLSSERMATFAAARDAAAPPELVAAWEHAAANWEDPAAHDALFQRVTASGSYAWAAARYRKAARTRPSTDDTAARVLERLTRAAEVTMVVTATARSADAAAATPYRNTIAILAFLVIALVGLVVYQLVRSQSSPDDAPAAQIR